MSTIERPKGYESCRKIVEAETHKPIVETRNPPVTFLEQFDPDKAFEMLLAALKEGGWEEMDRLLGLKMGDSGSDA